MNREMHIAEHRIADDEPPFIVAEIGHNHQGDLAKAKALFKAAAEAGADAVKLQKRDNRALFTDMMYDSPYHSENAFGPTYGAHREALEFGRVEYSELQDYAASLGLIFFATAFDIPSANFLDDLGVPAFKIASGDLKTLPLIRYVAQFGVPVIVSTGGGRLEDVRAVVHCYPWRPGQLALLQCTATYPCPPEEMNLGVIAAYRQQFPEVTVGLSDHYDGIMTAGPAYMLGARIMEKHFTLDHNWKGSDQRFSLEPDGLRRMIRDLSRLREALGDGEKRPYESEAPGLAKMSKSLVAVRDLPAGHRLTAADIEMRSPGGGMAPYLIDSLIGRSLTSALQKHEAFRLERTERVLSV